MCSKEAKGEFLPSSDLSCAARVAAVMLEVLANLQQTNEERLENATIIAPRCVHLLGIIRLSMDPHSTLKSSWNVMSTCRKFRDVYTKEVRK